ncbi:alpha/beta hydrolase domain-containing protein [Sterolibacterium denitrificans]|nr:alpha/beta hydrolase domain-containing protein [Sterolibacterium denitrificans]
MIKAALVVGLFASVLLTGCNGDSSNDGAPPEAGSGTSPQQGSVANPLVAPPSSNGLGMISVSSTMFPLGLVGYTADEYFISGNAVRYAPDEQGLPEDGRWNLHPVPDSKPYKTRIVVYRPKNPAKFNGTVVVEWLNVSGGLDAAPGWINAHTELIRSGYAWVGVSAQKEGIDGGGAISMMDLPLKTFDWFRYGSLRHPGNPYSFDIFSQAAQAIRHPQGLNPLDGLTIKKMIASGQSQSAMYMTTYINGISPLTRLFDGFMIHSRPFGMGSLDKAGVDPTASMDLAMKVRTDQAPVMLLQTESENFLLNYYSSRQDDDDNFRLWEMAGTSHADLYTLTGLFDIYGNDIKNAQVTENKEPMPGIVTCAKPVNSGPQHFIASAAYAALNNWVTAGVRPAIAPRLTVNPAGTDYVRDAHGNVLGGIRTPYVDVPTATISAYGQPGSMEEMGNDAQSFCFLFGTTALFATLPDTPSYQTHTAYVNAVKASANAAAAQGFLLPADVRLIVKAAEASTVGY